MKYTLGKEERLKSKKLIEKLYENGNSIKVFPLRIVFLQIKHTSNYPTQVGFSVSKRNFKLAVKRNRLKRLMRETYRLQKDTIYNNIEEPYVFMISYIGREEIAYKDLFGKMEKLLLSLLKELKNNKKNKNENF